MLPRKSNTYEIDLADLEFGDLLGQGTFGAVFCGKWKSSGFDVALKKVNITPDASDAKVMMELGKQSQHHFFLWICLSTSGNHHCYSIGKEGVTV